MLELKNMQAAYTKETGNNIIEDIDLTIHDGEVVGIIGQNGAGKSTLAKALIRNVPFTSGEIYYNNVALHQLSTQAAINHGIGYFPQGGRIFPNLTVRENLVFAGNTLSREGFINNLKEIKDLLPFFKEKRSSMKMKAGYLSGGEKHQLTLAMALLKKPSLLILDEPSAGLSPSNVESIYEIFDKIKKQKKISILVIEQNISKVLDFADKLLLLKERNIQDITGKSLEGINKLYFEN